MSNDRGPKTILHSEAVYRQGAWEVTDKHTPLAAVLAAEGQEKRELEDEALRVAGEVMRELDMVHPAMVAALAEELGFALGEIRQQAVKTLIRYVWHNATCGLGAFKNFAVASRELDYECLGKITETEFAELFGEERATFNARRKRTNRKQLERWGFKGVTAPGGKSASDIEKFRRAAKGNHNRAGHADDLNQGEDDAAEVYAGDYPRRKDVSAADVKALYEESEKRRLEKLEIC
jgi:hypothetical protein